MLKEYFEVDDKGYIVNNHLLSEEDIVPTNYYPGWGELTLYEPMWDHTNMCWKDKLSPEEIRNLTKTQPAPPSESERMDALELILMDMMMKQQIQEMMDVQPPDLKL